MQGQTDERTKDQRQTDSQCASDQRQFLQMLRDYFQSTERVEIRLSALEYDVSEIKSSFRNEMAAIKSELHTELSAINKSLQTRAEFDEEIKPMLSVYTKGAKLKSKLGDVALFVVIVAIIKSALPAPLVELFIKLAAG